MKKLLILFIGLALFSCKQEVKEESENVELKESTEVEVEQPSRTFPDGITKIFDAHGTYKNWNSKQTLIYTIPSEENAETHIVDLKNRKTLITSNDYTIGYDGSDVWMNKEGKYKGNPRFYHNLYFYFYAMPFILGDKGITYDAAEDLIVEGKTYPGFKISYGENVGDSPDDNYFIHFDSDSGKMVWLGYTVTYFNGEPSDKISYIHYKDWNEVNGLLLPKSIQWYTVEEGVPTTPRGEALTFEDISVSEIKTDANKFSKIEGAIIATK